MKGYVYILTNPSFRDDWVKIGKSSREPDVRSKELDNTAVPLPFEVYGWLRTEKYNEAETLVHRMIDRLTDLRIRPNREFFNVPPELAFDILGDIAKAFDDSELWCKNQKPAKEQTESSVSSDNTSAVEHHKSSRFTFSAVDIPIGAELTFIPTGDVVRVASDNTVEYQGQIWKLSPFVREHMPLDRRNASGAYQGALFFSYEGENLVDRRRRYESQQKEQSANTICAAQESMPEEES